MTQSINQPPAVYTRRAAAQAAGISPSTLSNYQRRGIVQGTWQATDGGRWAKVYSQRDIKRLIKHHAQQLAKMPAGLKAAVYGPEPPKEEPQP